MSREKGNGLQRLLRGLELPPEMAMGQPQVTFSGMREVTAEPCRRLLKYDSTEIWLSLPTFVLKLSGSELSLQYYRAGAVRVGGKIMSAQFCQAEEQQHEK